MSKPGSPGNGAPFERGLGFVAGLMGALGAVALAALIGVTIVSVFWRYILRDPIFGIEDVSTMALTVFVAGAIAYGAVRGAHVTVDVIRTVANRPVIQVTDALAKLLGAAIAGFATYGLFSKGACGLPCGALTANLGIVHTPFYYVLGAAFGFYALLLAYQFISGLATGSDPQSEEPTG